MAPPKQHDVSRLLEEEEGRQEIYRELRRRGIPVEPLEPSRAAQLAEALATAKARERRVGALTTYLIDQMEHAQADFIIDQVANAGGIGVLPAVFRRVVAVGRGDVAPGPELLSPRGRVLERPVTVDEFMAFWETHNRPPLPLPEIENNTDVFAEVEDAFWRANSVFNARLLAPVRIAGNITATVVVDVYAEERYRAIERTWALTLLALAIGATAGYAGTLLTPAAPVALPAGFVPVASAAPMLPAIAPPLISFSLPTFMGWASQSFVDPVAQAVLGTDPLMPAYTKLEESKAQLINAAFALEGSVGRAFGWFFLLEFLTGMGDFGRMIIDRLKEGQ